MRASLALVAALVNGAFVDRSFVNDIVFLGDLCMDVLLGRPLDPDLVHVTAALENSLDLSEEQCGTWPQTETSLEIGFSRGFRPGYERLLDTVDHKFDHFAGALEAMLETSEITAKLSVLNRGTFKSLNALARTYSDALAWAFYSGVARLENLLLVVDYVRDGLREEKSFENFVTRDYAQNPGPVLPIFVNKLEIFRVRLDQPPQYPGAFAQWQATHAAWLEARLPELTDHAVIWGERDFRRLHAAATKLLAKPLRLSSKECLVGERKRKNYDDLNVDPLEEYCVAAGRSLETLAEFTADGEKKLGLLAMRDALMENSDKLLAKVTAHVDAVVSKARQIAEKGKKDKQNWWEVKTALNDNHENICLPGNLHPSRQKPYKLNPKQFSRSTLEMNRGNHALHEIEESTVAALKRIHTKKNKNVPMYMGIALATAALAGLSLYFYRRKTRG